MRNALFIFISLLLSVGVFQVNSVLAEENSKEIPTRIVIKYKNETNNKNNAYSNYQSIKHRNNIEILEVPHSKVETVVNSLEKNSNIEFVAQEQIYTYLGSVDDPYYSPYQTKAFSSVMANQAWDLFIPKQTPIVAVIDSGIDSSNPDLKNQLYKPYNVLTPGTFPSDNLGHGTHVAGIIGAQTNNGTGIASISKGTKIMPIKVGNREYIRSFDIAEGIYHAVDNGADIINISIGGEYDPYVEEACNYAYEKGVLVIAAAGNKSTSEYTYPAALKNVVSVAAIDNRNDTLADFSNYGSWVSIAAPGVDIFSTYPKNFDFQEPFGYESMDGTSMAAPMVASFAALLKNQDPNLTNNQLRWLIESTSVEYNGSSLHSNGKMNVYNALSTYNDYTRIFGNTSVETSNMIAENGWDSNNPSYGYLKPLEENINKDAITDEGTFAILASNQSFPDSLAAGSLALQLDAPILLTFPDILKQSTIDTLKKLQVKKVLILGGNNAVTDEVLNGISNAGFFVRRIEGSERYSTAAKINDYIASSRGKVIVVSGKDFPDALSVSSFAASNQIPIVFVEKDKIPSATENFLNKYQFNESIVIGGPSVISNQVVSQLPNAVRVSGDNRYETNTKVIEYFMNNQPVQGYLFATGRNFPDALSGGILSAKLNYPILLVNYDKIPYPTLAYIRKSVSSSDIFFDMISLGGKNALTPSVIWELDNLLYDDWYHQNYLDYNQLNTPSKKLDVLSISK